MDNPSKRKQIFGADKEVVALVRLVLNSDSSHVLPVKPLCQIVIDYYGHFECHEISCFYGVDAYLSNLQIVRHNGQTFLFTASQRDQLIAISPNSFNYNFGRFGETTCNADPLRSAHTFCVLNSGTILTVAYNDNSRHFITRWFLSINNGEPTIKRENSTGEGWVSPFCIRFFFVGFFFNGLFCVFYRSHIWGFYINVEPVMVIVILPNLPEFHN